MKPPHDKDDWHALGKYFAWEFALPATYSDDLAKWPDNCHELVEWFTAGYRYAVTGMAKEILENKSQWNGTMYERLLKDESKRKAKKK